MDAFRQWALCIIIAAAAGTFACVISPKGSLDKTVRAVVGIFVVASICAPLSQLKNIESADYKFAVSDYDEDITDSLSEYTLSACKSAVENEILSCAATYGIGVESMTVDAYIDKENCIIIQNIHVETHREDENKISGFSSEIEAKLGLHVTVNAE